MEQKQRKPIGRKERKEVKAQIEANASNLAIKEITLESGKKASFRYIVIPNEQIENMTFIDEEVNGREQSALTKDSLREVRNTIGDCQFYTCFGYLSSDDRYGLIDGSRRRKSAIMQGADLELYVTEDKAIAVSDLIVLARKMQSAREHNMREEGRKYKALKNSGHSQKEIAEMMGVSTSQVSRSIDAYEIDLEIMLLFPDPGAVTFRMYVYLVKLIKDLVKSKIEVKSFCDSVKSELGKKGSDYEYDNEYVIEIMEMVFAKITGHLAIDGDKPQKTPLRDFKNKNKKANKLKKGDSLKFEFKGFPDSKYDEIEKRILSVLTEYE